MATIRVTDGRPPVLRETTGERLRRLRLAKGWSQMELGLRAGTSQFCVWNLERGSESTAHTLSALAEVLGTCLCYLWAGGAGCEHDGEAAS